jgi:hypothetical protein
MEVFSQTNEYYRTIIFYHLGLKYARGISASKSILDAFIISLTANTYKSVCKNKNPPCRRALKK